MKFRRWRIKTRWRREPGPGGGAAARRQRTPHFDARLPRALLPVHGDEPAARAIVQLCSARINISGQRTVELHGGAPVADEVFFPGNHKLHPKVIPAGIVCALRDVAPRVRGETGQRRVIWVRPADGADKTVLCRFMPLKAAVLLGLNSWMKFIAGWRLHRRLWHNSQCR